MEEKHDTLADRLGSAREHQHQQRISQPMCRVLGSLEARSVEPEGSANELRKSRVHRNPWTVMLPHVQETYAEGTARTETKFVRDVAIPTTLVKTPLDHGDRRRRPRDVDRACLRGSAARGSDPLVLEHAPLST
jgi:hypothetical protein